MLGLSAGFATIVFIFNLSVFLTIPELMQKARLETPSILRSWPVLLFFTASSLVAIAYTLKVSRHPITFRCALLAISLGVLYGELLLLLIARET
jgi:hypothetical protein